jgi:hypothetical protein
MEADEICSSALFCMVQYLGNAFCIHGTRRITVAMRKVLAAGMFLSLCGCTTHLTESGKRIRVVPDGDMTQVKNCEQLSYIRGTAESFLSSGEYGVIYATKNARNKAGEFPLADTLVLTGKEPSRFGGEVTGVAYNCSQPRGVTSASSETRVNNPVEMEKKSSGAPAKSTGDTIFEKAKKCQLKGGVWVNSACIISID